MTPAPRTTRRRAYVSFGHNLRTARIAARLTQDALAQRLGFQRATAISLWERSTHVPEPKTIRKIAAAIGCTPAALLRNVITDYDVLRQQRITLTPAELQQLEAQAISDDDRHLLDVWHQLVPATQAKFMSLFEHMVDERLGTVPDGRVLEARPALRRASEAASLRAAAARPRRQAG